MITNNAIKPIYKPSFDRKLLKLPYQIRENIFHRVISINFHQHLLLPVIIHHLHCFVIVRIEPFQNRLLVIVHSSACLSPLQKPPSQYLLRTLHVHNKRMRYLVKHLDIPVLQVLLVTRKTVNQELPSLPTIFMHCFLQQSDCDFAWNNFSFHNILLD